MPKRQALAWNCSVARPHTARQTQALLREQFHCDIFEHPPYSPDLVPSDFFLFPKMKEHLAGKRFANDGHEECCRQPHGMKRVYTNWYQGMTTSALMSKVTMWKSRQRYCICHNLYIQFLYFYKRIP